MERIELKYKKVKPNAIEPTRGSEYAAGLDLYACIDEEITIKPGCTEMIGTGIALEIPHGMYGAIVARSGLSIKEDLAPANKFGVIDSDYRAEVMVALHNHSTEVYRSVKPNQRIAQLLILPYYVCDQLIEVDELSETQRGANGFGSTGKF